MKPKSKKVIIIVAICVVLFLLLCCFSILIIPIIFSSNSTQTNSTENRVIDILDTFDDNKYGWGIGTSNGDYGKSTKTIIEGKYILSLESKSETGALLITNAKIEKSKSMITSVDVDQVVAPDTGEYKLLFMYQDESNYYSFKINQYYQQYSIGIIQNGKWTEWVGWTRDAIINWKTTNNMKIVSEDGVHTFYINDKKVFQKSDKTYTSGGSCLAVQLYNKNQTGNWKFDNFKYKKLK